MAPYFISGLLYGQSAYRSGSFWMSVALHMVNNFTGLVFVGTKGDAIPSANGARSTRPAPRYPRLQLSAAAAPSCDRGVVLRSWIVGPNKNIERKASAPG